MKNLKFLIALFSITLFTFTSCQKESLEDIQSGQETEMLSGEELPTTAAVSTEEIQAIRDQQIQSFKKEAQDGSLAFTRTSGATSRSRTITDINCGSTMNGTTRGETNTVSKYSGADKVYLLEVSSKKDVKLQLSNLRSDLDMFVAEVLVDGFGRKLIGTYLAADLQGGTSSETIDIALDRGEYFIIIETYGFESDFRLSVSCSGGPTTPNPEHCEDFQNLTAGYHVGISDQSNLWNLWSNTANDALVLHENSNSSNKVVKIDNSRFGYQDVVRDIIGLPLTRGWYTMEFDMYVAQNSVAEFLTEKTSSYGQEQGVKFKVKNNRLTITYRGKEYTANTRISSNTWTHVAMSFDMVNNRVIVLMNGIRITMRADTKLNSRNLGRKSIQGINFFGNEANSKFYIDNVCIQELEEGYDNPVMPFIINGSQIEEIDLTGA